MYKVSKFENGDWVVVGTYPTDTAAKRVAGNLNIDGFATTIYWIR